MAGVATSYARSLLEEYWLHLSSEELEVQFGRWRGGHVCDGRATSRSRGSSDPRRDRLPLRIVLRLPELAASVRRVAPGFCGQGVQEEAALQRIGRSHEPG